ncbi:copper resistance protein B [Indioceanicola profundi]|uniref:copper resistance protein B n=1 Tax=Indioceanicola profundi TaxID=2220096 RepID=UPI000E6AB8B6|nr:copper resistance protein B [Indioceanicola profundi]
MGRSGLCRAVAGFTHAGAGIRLKYEIARKFAPYVGLAWERRLGRTAELVRTEGEEADRLSLVTGLSFWF